MEMITAKEYASKIKKFDLDELTKERKKLLSSIEYLEKINAKKNKDIYVAKLGYLIECLKLIQKKTIKKEEAVTNKDELREGDIVKINNKKYKVSILIDKKTGVKIIDDEIEIHVIPKNADDFKFIKRVFNRYIKQLN